MEPKLYTKAEAEAGLEWLTKLANENGEDHPASAMLSYFHITQAHAANKERELEALPDAFAPHHRATLLNVQQDLRARAEEISRGPNPYQAEFYAGDADSLREIGQIIAKMEGAHTPSQLLEKPDSLFMEVVSTLIENARAPDRLMALVALLDDARMAGAAPLTESDWTLLPKLIEQKVEALKFDAEMLDVFVEGLGMEAENHDEKMEFALSQAMDALIKSSRTKNEALALLNTFDDAYLNDDLPENQIDWPALSASVARRVREQLPTATLPEEPTQRQLISACFAYRHDYGMLDEESKKRLQDEGRAWWRSVAKETNAPSHHPMVLAETVTQSEASKQPVSTAEPKAERSSAPSTFSPGR